MNINATLIIQAINFLIAYLLLRTILLKPAIHVIQADQLAQDNQHKAIAEGEKRAAQKEQEKEKAWRGYQYYFLEKTPEVIKPELMVFQRISPELKRPVVADEVILQLIDKTQSGLIKKVMHDHA